MPTKPQYFKSFRPLPIYFIFLAYYITFVNMQKQLTEW